MDTVRIKFTDVGLRNLQPRKTRYIAWKLHGNGMGLRVSPHGRKTFVYQYRFRGRARLMTLGSRPFPEMSLAEANLLHAEARKKLEEGVDPGVQAVAMRHAGRHANREDEIVRELCARIIQAANALTALVDRRPE